MGRGQTERELISLLSSLLILTPFTIQTQARSLLQACPSSSCGDIQNISYPFRLNGEPANCGDPDYELSCENNRTIMKFHSGRYYVKEISYAMRKIRLADVNLANGTCNLPYRSLSSDDVTVDIRYNQGLNFFNFASFINCSTTIIRDPSYRKLPCVGGNTSQVYVTIDGSLYDIPVGCSFLSVVPVGQIPNVNNPSYDAILKLMESGFELEWSVECRNCQLRNKTCYVTTVEVPFNYHCDSDNLVSTIAKIIFSAGVILLYVKYFIARFIFAPVVIIEFLLHKFCKERKRVDNVETFLRNQQSLMPKRYSYADLVAVTNHFKDKLGKGGFGSVYKGQLPGGILIAVKMLENTKFTAEEFINEVSTIGRIHHVNVVKLLGFCSEGSNRALIYEYMPNGSLDKHIFSNNGKAQSFSWAKLLEIALGTARGVSSKSDVYSFGMLLLEMAGGRKNVDSKAKSSSRVYFPSWVYNHLAEGQGDLELENVNEIELETARKLCIVGLWCIQMKPSDRPSMTKVVEMLEGSVKDLKMPPRPFLCEPSDASTSWQASKKEPQSDASTSGQASEIMEEPLLNGD
ncbi:hypothetical protein Vadar_015307 [Vaccinium darrowii]|uniref:Uncharacterized protein n=1 Tax=Vaccinium darrowii TaxID=229202 RepID=A0ACB7X0V5_9ERIC|nr:hypothetical protein Vadar_015307 [Vaccinium darrowii]